MSTNSETKEELDDTDLKILSLLQENAFTSYEDLGNHVGLAESTVRYRVKKLEELGVILGFTCAVDLKKLGYDLMAFAHIDVASGKERVVAKRISKMPNVIALFSISGGSDLISLIVARKNEELSQIVENIRAMKDVSKMTCSLALKTYKLEYVAKPPLNI